MNCYACGSPTKVVFSTPLNYAKFRYRVRICKKVDCGRKIETVELPAVYLPKGLKNLIEKGRKQQGIIFKWLKNS